MKYATIDPETKDNRHPFLKRQLPIKKLFTFHKLTNDNNHGSLNYQDISISK